MMRENSQQIDDDVRLVQRLERAAAGYTADRDLDVSEIRRRLSWRRRNRRVIAGGLAMSAAAIVMVAFFVSRYPLRIDLADRNPPTEAKPQLAQGLKGQHVDDGGEFEQLLVEAEAARVRAELFQVKLNACKQESRIRAEEVSLAKLIRAKAEQEFLLKMVDGWDVEGLND